MSESSVEPDSLSTYRMSEESRDRMLSRIRRNFKSATDTHNGLVSSSTNSKLRQFHQSAVGIERERMRKKMGYVLEVYYGRMTMEEYRLLSKRLDRHCNNEIRSIRKSMNVDTGGFIRNVSEALRDIASAY